MTNKPEQQGYERYIAARYAWNEAYGTYIEREKHWRRVAVISLILATIAAAGLILIASQNQIIPYIVEVDRNQHPLHVYSPEQPQEPTEHQTKAILARFVENWRSVTSDPELQRKAINNLYAHLTDSTQAANRLNDWFREHGPFQRAQAELVKITVQSVLLISSNSWRVDWVETLRDPLALQPPEEVPFSATLGIKRGRVTEQMVFNNPLGVFVVRLDWQKENTAL